MFYILSWSLFINLFIVYTVVSDYDEPESLLKAFSYSHIGSSETRASCPDNNGERSYFGSARLRLSTYLNQTHPTVNAIEFRCSDEIHTTVSADARLLLQKDVGDWTEWKECPNGGFVTGITLYLQAVSSANLIPEENPGQGEAPEVSRVFDVFELGRSRYISGISLNCSFYSEVNESVDDNANGTDVNDTSPSSPAWKETTTLGRPSGMGLRLYCLENRVISGISVKQEAIITFEEGERWIPLDIKTKCTILRSPIKPCNPELDWETRDSMTCTNITHTNRSGYTNVSCQVPHFIGLSPNKDIENLNRILRAYQILDLEGKEMKAYLRSRLLSPRFITDWERKYKLDMSEYRQAIQRLPVNTYTDFKEQVYQANFTHVSYNEPDYCKKIRDNLTEPLIYEFSVKQLVGFCSIYKYYFPLFRTKYQMYFERKIDGLNSRIIFAQVGPNTNVSELINMLKSKFVLWTQA